MKNILSTVANKNFQLIASYNGLTEDMLDKRVVLHYRTLFPTKSNKFIAIELTESQLQSIISNYSNDKTTILELYGNASCIIENESIQFLTTAETGSTYSIELLYKRFMLNFFDNISTKLETKEIIEEVYSCRHVYLGESALSESNNRCICNICKADFSLDIDREKLLDSKNYIIETLQAIKAINVELSDEDIKKIASMIVSIDNIEELLDDALKVLNKY